LISCRTAADWAGVPELLVKDESQNPTWSHKDRLSVCTVSAAVAAGATGTVISSSGNHGASAAAYSARAGLACIVLCDDGVSSSHAAQMRAYGAAVVSMPRAARWPMLERLSREPGWYLVGNTAEMHTGHPFGPEGYKTIAYELFSQLGNTAPAAISVPTSYGELLFGIGKGFGELRAAGLIEQVPMLVSAEPDGSDALARAWNADRLSIELEPAYTIARGIGSNRNGYRGLSALRASAGLAVAVSDQEIIAAQRALARDGLWPKRPHVPG
jgi:threonine synthase